MPRSMGFETTAHLRDGGGADDVAVPVDGRHPAGAVHLLHHAVVQEEHVLRFVALCAIGSPRLSHSQQ